jgi:hypothetical protein
LSPPGTNEPSDADSPGTSLERVVDAVSDLTSGIPAPIRRNALKAFSRLWTAAIDVPVAMLEGRASELRAESQARVRIIEANAQGIAAQIQVDPAYAHAAVRKFGQRIVREQVNLDKIAEAAARQLKEAGAASDRSSAPTSTAPSELSDDWLNVFEKEASQKSSADVQLAFSRILAGEIRNPSSYSIKTLRLLGQLDGHAAALFQRVCSLACALRVDGRVLDARVVSLGGNAAQNSLAEYGLNFGGLNILHEYGLIIPDYNSYMDFRIAVARENTVRAGFEFNSALWALRPDADFELEQPLPIHGVALSRSGVELLPVVERIADAVYATALADFFRAKKLTMTSAASPPGV